jgi:O-antigen/teichoic acid export membrane protein
LVAAVVLGGVCAAYLVRYVHFAFDRAAVKRALLYSIPLIPHFLSHWVLGSADRVILERLVPLDAVGVYNVGYQIGMGMSVLAVAANNAIVPVYGKLGSDEVSRERVRRLTTYFVVAVIGIGLCISLFGEDLIRVVTPVSYHEAGTVVPWVVCGYVFMALYFPATNLLTITHGHSQLVSIATVVGAFANIGLNFLVIPHLGIHGAAVTTTFTYAIMMVIVTVLAERTERLPVDYGRIGKAVACGFATFAIAWWAAPDGVWIGGAVKLALLLSFPTSLVLTGFLDPEEWSEVRSVRRRLMGGTEDAPKS